MAKPHRASSYYLPLTIDIEALPPHVVGEIVRGALYASRVPRPGTAQQQPSSARKLAAPSSSGTDVQATAFSHLVPNCIWVPPVLVPDLAGWRRERLPEAPATPYFESPPDWVCEILSPSTMRPDRAEKLPLYGEFGVAHAWYVDPLAKTLEVFALADGKWLLAATFSNADAVTAPPFEARTFALDRLWPFG